MDLTIRLVLIALYPVLLGARLVSWARGRDPLRRREPQGSCWSERPAPPPPREYFSESAVGERASATLALLTLASRAFAPRRDRGDATPSKALPSDIPDEVYTLW